MAAPPRKMVVEQGGANGGAAIPLYRSTTTPSPFRGWGVEQVVVEIKIRGGGNSAPPRECVGGANSGGAELTKSA